MGYRVKLDAFSSPPKLFTSYSLSLFVLSSRRDLLLSLSVRANHPQIRHSERMLSDKLDFAIEFRERLANIESRMPKQSKWEAT